MILINLLPHRERKRQERKRAFMSALGLSALIGVGMVIMWFVILQQMTGNQDLRNAQLQQEIKKLDAKIAEISSLRADIEALRARQFAVESLQTDRNVPIYLLNELVKQTPDGVYLTGVREGEAAVSISGIAQSNERVSEFLRNTANNSPWLLQPELIEIKSIVQTIGKDQTKLFDFSMRVKIKRPEPPAGPGQKKTGAGSSPGKA